MWWCSHRENSPGSTCHPEPSREPLREKRERRLMQRHCRKWDPARIRLSVPFCFLLGMSPLICHFSMKRLPILYNLTQCSSFKKFSADQFKNQEFVTFLPLAQKQGLSGTRGGRRPRGHQKASASY